MFVSKIQYIKREKKTYQGSRRDVSRALSYVPAAPPPVGAAGAGDVVAVPAGIVIVIVRPVWSSRVAVCCWTRDGGEGEWWKWVKKSCLVLCVTRSE